MRKYNFFLILLASLLFFSIEPTFGYNINRKKISVSGISAGAFFAQQLHISSSDLITEGVAVIAGGPYYCAAGNINQALNSCMKTNGPEVSLDQIVTEIKKLAEDKQISDYRNISKAKIFLIAGQSDDVIARSVVQKSRDLYLKLNVPEKNTKFIEDLNVGHAFPTVDFGNSCQTPRSSPFISRCDYDTAYEIFHFFKGHLKKAADYKPENLKFISQKLYFENSQNNHSMADQAALYVPTNCQNGEECSLHISFHGCLQSRDDIKDDYITQTGFNAWAESNNIIVLYPQVVKNFISGNPQACWDWWGYTGSNYHTKKSVQISIITQMIQDLMKP